MYGKVEVFVYEIYLRIRLNSIARPGWVIDAAEAMIHGSRDDSLGQSLQDGVHFFSDGGQGELKLILGFHHTAALVPNVLQGCRDVDFLGTWMSRRGSRHYNIY